MNLPTPDELLDKLAAQMLPLMRSDCAFLGIHTGGVWVMDALAERLGADVPRGVLDIAFYRDDFSRIGLHPEVKPSRIPFEVENRHILLVDDVLYTGRTVRAALNLIFDYGRPAAVRLAVLADRGGRELPVCPDFVGAMLYMADDEHISLVREEDGRLHWVLKQRPVA